MLLIPQELIDKFVSVSCKNVSKEDGKHLETLAFLSGTLENGNLIGSDLIFPQQNCQPNGVEDQGKIILFHYRSTFFKYHEIQFLFAFQALKIILIQ